MSTPRSFIIGLALFCAGCLVRPIAADAAALPDRGTPIGYEVVDQSLHDLLGEIGSQLGTRVSVSDALSQHVRGRLPPAPPREYLDRLASVYGFDWYYDGATLFVSTAKEAQSKLLNLGPVPLERLNGVLGEIGIADPRWPLRGSDDAGFAMLSGPPHYVDLVEQALSNLQQRARPDTADVRIFRGARG